MNKIYFSTLLYSSLVLLMLSIINGFMFKIDYYVHQFLNQYLPSGTVVQTLHFISNVFSPFNCLLLVLFLLTILFFKNKDQFLLYGFWSFSVFLIGTIMKYTIGRSRPSLEFDGYSFPSMHVLSVSLLVTLLILITKNKWTKIVGTALIITMMISRVYVNAHYFSDTIGSLIVLTIMLLSLRLAEEKESHYETNEKR
ncbi:phosphatase PAP2 family protein [Staphylococcus saprophyticus]|jgi:membrane-associated phospholipid phosphatase|uniref:Phospholipid phosphatase n=1 Tax=Staphylococcus saprophyticus TaxID=29385 RepID=A0A380JPF2_STASA|nr:phosphatase PAP2 family protein [Staphylococcus saprophyticus]MBC2922059.1 phosphatase PAP2 family protein [Staphylococcus saprophyticus]MBC2958627.1 phosphatase PAP2 family protein [Staphylococcus saprophyticus]MBC3010504.1 phosphatase PAP2 family protein [Staphylococcus saprophyticus]MBC3024379.1 phosphatase PAP2 family protein [Staphylococcus saprophyticus]MBC3031582.1 phosphatase PAP2 family protein [Staphylococcus saprophyticus]